MKWETEQHLTERQRTWLVVSIVIGLLVVLLWALTDTDTAGLPLWLRNVN
jgi:hypothetical protein